MENRILAEATAVALLKKGEGRTIKSGGLWIYDNEIASIMGSCQDGDMVIVRDFDGYPMGKGFINRQSKITIRMMTRNPEQEIDEEFIEMRVKNAWDYRKTVMQSGLAGCDVQAEADVREEADVQEELGVRKEYDNRCHILSGGKNSVSGDLNCCRVIFGEADFLPGLVIDKFADVLVVESLALGIDRLKPVIIDKLIKLMAGDGIRIRGVYERSDAKVRKKEGMLPTKGFIGEEFDTKVEIVENGVHYIVDVENGQKTGFFLDQKYNRLAMQRIIKGLVGGDGALATKRSFDKEIRVLDCFTHMGTFALNAGLAGGADVTGLDISEFAIKQANENARINNLSDRVHFKVANVLDELPKLAAAGEKYDVVILDPPAFTKSREATRNAIKGYREINMKGLKLVKDGGYFATCSCSHFMTQELFTKVIGQAASAVHKRLRQVEFRTQAPDHPILWAADESYYLKFYVFQVMS